MHIPDGYLGPKTCAALYAVMIPLWYAALKRAEKTLGAERFSLVAFSSAFVFLVMMLNFPVPGGTTGHVVGGALVGILLGPWVGFISMTLVLFLQAVVFADGGITTFGANSFNMAFLMAFSGHYIFRMLDGGKTGRMAPFLAGYLAVNIAAVATAFELGIQPSMESDPAGRPLYAPYPLKVALPAMAIPHILFLGPIEGAITALTVGHVRKKGGELMYKPQPFRMRRLWILNAVLIVVSPIGLLASGSAWGEWSAEELSSLLGYVPSGMERLGELWKGALPDYGVYGVNPAIGYIISALLGSALVVFFIYFLGRARRKRL
jgi:cobalt/nickel transport system permease protein